MNYREGQQRKFQPLRSIHQTTYFKCGSAAIPSKKPPIPQYFLQYTQKKQPHHTYNKQNRIFKQSNHQSIWMDGDKSSKGRYAGMGKGSLHRASQTKIQEQKQVKKGKKDVYYGVKNSKGIKNSERNRREVRHTIDAQNSESIQRLRMNNWNRGYEEENKERVKFDFNCRQKIKKMKIKKPLFTQKLENTSLQMSSKTVLKTHEQEIAEFKQKTQQIQIETESEAIKQIALKENEEYRLDINHILKKQPNIPWIKRAIVINWMMETLADFGSKRQTFAISVRLLDHYLALSHPIPLEELQTLAVTSMYIANKLEDHIFGVKDICDFTGNDSDIILIYELKMVSKLKWKLNPPTSNMWANRLSIQWDQYIDKYSMQCEFVHRNREKLKFWTQNTEGYYNYRQLMQYLDFAILEINTLRYHCRDLAASFMYIIFNIRLQIYPLDYILNNFPTSSTYLLEVNQFNLYFNEFLIHSFGVNLRDLLPAIQYCSTFLILPLCYKLPKAVEGEEQITYSQFCSYQTCNENNLVWLRKRDRTYE